MIANTEPKAAPGIDGRRLKFYSMDRFKVKLSELAMKRTPLITRRDRIFQRIGQLQGQLEIVEERITKINGEMAGIRGHLDMVNIGAKFYKIETREVYDGETLRQRYTMIRFFDDQGNEIDLAPKPANGV